MGKKPVILLVLIFSLLLTAIPATAQEGYVLQTGDLSINSWHFHYSRHTFSVSEPGFATLTVTKITPDKDINRGFLFMNRRAIPLKHFFRGNDTVFERKIKLREYNRLNVFLKGTPDAAIKIDIHLNDAPEPPPTVIFEATPLTITIGETSTLTWQSENAESVTIDNGIGNVSVDGSAEIVPVETTTYTLTATGPGGTTSAQATVTVNPLPPTVEMTAAPDTIVVGESAVLSWSSDFAESCVIEPDIGVVGLNGSTTVTPAQTTTYKIIATGEGGEASAQVTITVTDPEPTVEINAAASTIILGESTTLSWTSTHTDTCSIEPGIGAVTPAGSVSVSPTQTTTYTITATGSGGTATDQVTIAVQHPVPTVSLSASPSSVLLGQSSTLSWTTTNADIVEIDRNIGTVDTSGSHQVSPNVTTTYTLTATGPGGTTTAETTVMVTYPQPTVDLQISPDTILVGESATLSWTSTNAVSVSIDNGIGTVAGNGSMNVSPTTSTAYTITATGVDGSTATKTVALTVNYPPPSITITASPDTIYNGQSTTLIWSASNADSCDIQPDVGTVAVSGTTVVSPTSNTTYTISATGAGGTTVSTVDVTVNELTAPLITLDQETVTIAQGESVTLSWTSLGADTAHMDNGVGTVPTSGTVTVTPEHTTIYTLSVTGATGSASARIKVHITGAPIPPTEGTWGELYSDKIPSDATVAGYDDKRFALVVGEVVDIDGNPIEGVLVHIRGHLEYGTCITDVLGRFTLPVDGGALMTVVYEKDGLIASHRQVHTPWNDFVVAETVTMLSEDPAATTVTFDGNADIVFTHKSTPYTDSSGTRSTTLVFAGDNRAFLTDENGADAQELTTIRTRATEFVTLESMPAMLPPTSAYTYCAELTVDGAKNVRFEKPVVMWVNNFVGFDVGGIVPVGYYNRDRGVWVAEDNGIVVRLLDLDADGIVDALDADGDDLPDDLNTDGNYDDEVKGLEDPTAYIAGDTYWRAMINHFSPYDLNWPSGNPPDDAEAPEEPDEPEEDEECEDDCKGAVGSYVEERSRIFHENIPIPGTDLTLHYASNRTKGYIHKFTVHASGDTVPASLQQIHVEASVAGKFFVQKLPALPNQKAEFAWDGYDRFGRYWSGRLSAGVRIGYEYPFVYGIPTESISRAFGGSSLLGNAGTTITRTGFIIWTNYTADLRNLRRVRHQNYEPTLQSFAHGWELSNHHWIDKVKDPYTLNKGNGETVNHIISDYKTNYLDIRSLVTLFAGNTTHGYSGDGGPATKAQLNIPRGIAVDAVGNIYIADAVANCIRKVDTDGIITTVAGNGTAGYSGDGGLATDAMLNGPGNVAVDAAGNIYITDFMNYRVRKVDTNGIITTVAGNGSPDSNGNGGLAINAALNPVDVALDASGNLFIVDNYLDLISETFTSSIRRIDSAGYISSLPVYEKFIAPDCPSCPMPQISGITFDSGSNLYFSDALNHSIYKLDRTGATLERIAGIGYGGNSGDGGPATEALLNNPTAITVDTNGNIYVLDFSNARIRKVSTSGIITTVAGQGATGLNEQGQPVEDVALLSDLSGIAINPAGELFVSYGSNAVVGKIGPLVSYFHLDSVDGKVYAEENGLGHHIDELTGLHLKTVNLNTGVVLREFGYDEDRNLESITDQFGNQTVIQRDIDGTPIAIVSPEGLVTTLTLDSNQNITRITYPDNSFYDFEYTLDGLMTAEIEPNGNRFEHLFDEYGRLTQVLDQENGNWTYSRSFLEDGSVQVDVTTGEGNRTSYKDHTDAAGVYTSTITDPTGADTLFTKSTDGMTVSKTLSCGMQLGFEYGIDTEYKHKYLTKRTQATPAGLEKVTEFNRTYQDSDSNGVSDQITNTISLNGKNSTVLHSVLTAEKVFTSPEGRTIRSTYDPSSLALLSTSVPGLNQTEYGYDLKGRLTSTITGTRQVLYTYDTNGYMDSMTDPENRTTYYTNDEMGRVTAINRPDGSSLGFDYDDNGNMTVLTNPEVIDHDFSYNAVNLRSGYQAPLSGSYSYLYDSDRRLITTTFPSGRQINNIYTTSQLTQIQTPEGNIDLTYRCSDLIGTMTKGSEGISFDYDGNLITSITLSGTLNQSIELTYNSDFLVEAFSYAGNTESYTYDLDNLLTGAGSYTITRNNLNGLPETVTGGVLNIGRTFNAYGELENQNTVVNGSSMIQWSLIRDDNGRITNKTETVAGITNNYIYSYDPLGRLETVTKDGTVVESYGYDPDGTRTSETNTLRGITSRTLSYSDEDHLLTAGSVTYNYDLDGYLTTKTNGASVTTYQYSSRGELLQVDLPDGRIIVYEHDPNGRRIAKRINGVIVEKYLWKGMATLLAIYDGSDSLIQRFEYADGRMPVAMTQGAITYYMAYDQVGSLRLVTDTSGNVVKHIDYDTFGNIIADTNPSFSVPFGFAGGLHDRDIGLVRFVYRDYDPDIGRWTAKDPIGYTGGDTDLYGYVQNNPVSWVDPFGLKKNKYGFSSPTIESFARAISSHGGPPPGATEPSPEAVRRDAIKVGKFLKQVFSSVISVVVRAARYGTPIPVIIDDLDYYPRPVMAAMHHSYATMADAMPDSYDDYDVSGPC